MWESSLVAPLQTGREHWLAGIAVFYKNRNTGAFTLDSLSRKEDWVNGGWYAFAAR